MLTSLPRYSSILLVMSHGFSLLTNLEAKAVEISGATLSLEASTNILYLSNPYLRDKALENDYPIQSGFGYEARPSLYIDAGSDTSRFSFQAESAVNVRRLDGLEELDAEDLSLMFASTYTGNRLWWKASAFSDQFSTPEHDSRLSDTVPTGETERLNLQTSYRYSPKTRLSVEYSHYNRNYDEDQEFNFIDQETDTIPVRAFYKLNDDTEIGAGLRYRTRKQEGSPFSTVDIAWHLALEGKVGSKLDMDLKVGVLEQKENAVSVNQSGDTSFLSAQVAWRTSQDTRVILSGSNDTYTSGLGDAVQNQRTSLASEWKITENILAQAKYERSNNRYDATAREDKLESFFTTLSYRANSQLMLSIELNQKRNESSNFGFNYRATSINCTTAWHF